MIDQANLERIVEFHGHMCPGLAFGIRAAEAALAEMGPHSQDEEVVAVAETDMCAVDAIQFMTGCTFGKGNLIHHDYGKNAYTFFRRSDGRAVRISARPAASSPPANAELMGRVQAGTATPEERQELLSGAQQWSQHLLAAPLEELYEVREVNAEPPGRARIHTSIECDACGEATMETRLRLLQGRRLCTLCFADAMAGRTRVSMSSGPAPGS